MTPLRGMHRVRWAADRDPEMQCAWCLEYLPITAEFWVPIHGLRRCRACHIEARQRRVREAMRTIRANPERRAAESAARHADYRANLEAKRTYHREWYRRNRSTLARFERSA